VAVLGPHGQRFTAHRPVVMGRNGMIASAQALATEAGIWTLRRGGNAVDAATTVSAVLSVVEPGSSGLGGDGFLMLYRPPGSAAGRNRKAEMRVLNATGRAPMRATLDQYRDGIPIKGMRSVSVPGLVDGCLSAHERFGRLSLASCLEPAIELAEAGFPVSYKLAAALRLERALLEFPSSRRIFAPHHQLLGPGEILVQVDLGRSLRLIAERGRKAFYEGEIADAIVTASRIHGGLLDADDLGLTSLCGRSLSPRNTRPFPCLLPPRIRAVTSCSRSSTSSSISGSRSFPQIRPTRSTSRSRRNDCRLPTGRRIPRIRNGKTSRSRA
jgi:gamma-glutamyltranspeptidase